MSPPPSLLPLKKRAINDVSSSSRPDPDDSSSSSPKKKRRANEAEHAAVALEAPAVPRHRRSARATADALSAAEKWLQKGKWVAVEQDSIPAAAPPPPPEKKFMDDGALSEALRLRLAELGATRPWVVYRKPLQKSDVCPNQNRLLVSCKRETLEGCPITPIFSAREWARVENKDAGLLVTALDGRGEPHALTCKFLDSNGGYRFISGWKRFLWRNGVSLDSRGRWTRGVDVEVLAFRSRALPRQPYVDVDGRLAREMEVDDHFHPDGSLGLILLLHEHGRRGAEREEDDDDDGDYDEGVVSQPVAREKKGKKQGANKRDDASAAGTEVGEAEASMSKVEMVGKYGESMSNMVLGIMMLRGTIISKEKESVEGDATTSKEKESQDDVKGGAFSKEEESRENVEGDAILKEESPDNVEGGAATISVDGDANLKVESRDNVVGGAISEERRDNVHVEGADVALD